MKFKIGLLVIALVSIGTIFIWWRCSQELAIEVIYDKAISALPIATLKNLRYASDKDKKELFQSFSQQFSIDEARKKIGLIRNPQIVLWFADHFGQIPKRGLGWYQENVLKPLESFQSTFWLVDLAAWRFLSIKEEELLKCADFRAFLRKQAQGDLNPAESSLVTDEATILQIPNGLASYVALRSKDFFIWLNQLPFSIDTINPGIADALVRKDMRAGSARFSLRQLGYQPQFLNTWSKSLQRNLLDIDNTQIFPLLQYLEGVYYALKIVDQCAKKGDKSCNIVFLLPNKEFTYYMLLGEKRPFEAFRRTIASFVLKKMQCPSAFNIKIYFYPFSYGKEFYDQPYEEQGESVLTDELINLLNFKNTNLKELL